MTDNFCDPPTFSVADVLTSIEKVDREIVIHLEPENFKVVARNNGDLALSAFASLKSVSCIASDVTLTAWFREKSRSSNRAVCAESQMLSSRSTTLRSGK